MSLRAPSQSSRPTLDSIALLMTIVSCAPNDQGMSRGAVFRAVGSMPLLASNRQGTPLCVRIHKPPRVGKVIKLIIV